MTLLCVLAFLVVPPAFASQRSDESTEVGQGKSKKKHKNQGAEEAPVPDPGPYEPEPEDGVWEWVDRLEGEIPREDAIEGRAELEQARASEATADETALLATSNHPLYLDLVDASEFDIPVAVNPEVEKWVAYFTGPGRSYYERWLGRSTRFRPMMYRELDKAGLPRDLVYLSMIESGYNAYAWSSASASGLWQFISSTGRAYDLRVDYWVDDRRDPEDSLGAAIAFLGELHRSFGKWELAWASYNGGPGRVKRAVAGAGSEDFWVLARGAWLHTETDNYVPKIMAAAIIGKHPERYGFTDIVYQDELVYETRPVEGNVPLDVIAKASGVAVEELQILNPALKRFVTPPEGYELRLPVGAGDRTVAALASMPAELKVVVTTRYKVRSGDTLSKIANKYGVTVSELMSANGLKSANRIEVGVMLEVPGQAGKEMAAPRPVEVASLPMAVRSDTSSASVSRPTTKSAPAAKATRHTVRSGDTLSELADRYGLSVGQLKSYNGLSTSTIQVGQSLRLTQGTAETAAKTSSRHTLRRGETLSGVADSFDVSVADLMRWNSIKDASDVEAGRVLVVSGPAATSASTSNSTTTVTVRSGDTLWEIANRNGVTVQQLQGWNGLKGTSIQAGQKLKVKK